jgi:hypothetical protein
MVWRLEAYPNPEGSCKVVISDSRIIYLDAHDDNIYELGKGPSATTVSAPQIVQPLGSSVMITGTVTDQTATGRFTTAGNIDFTLKGTPAISDADMAAWMEHLFQQRPIPTNATGVPVTIYAIDPNNNYIPIGNVTSDMNGNYGIEYTPEVPGTYHIFASFAGSESYGPSSATTYLSIGEATPTASPYAELAVPPTEMYILAAAVAIIVAIAIGFAVTILILKKR